MREIISQVLIYIGFLFITAGTFGLFKYKIFYSRLLLSSQIDTVGFLSVMIGIMLKSGLSFFSAKILIICILGLIISPLNTHAIARSAYKSGFKLEKEDKNAP